MRNKGAELGKLNRSEEAVPVYEELIRKFGDTPGPGISKIVKEVSELLRNSQINK